ncbi:MAG: PKD repeat protein [Cryomorphaceae bacterium]|jgi:PKD repeat protein
MKKIFLACLATIATVALFSQNTQENIVKCHTYEMQERLFGSDPALKEAAEILGAQILKRAKELERTGFQKDGDPYIIPVVFHIIHKYGPENISYAQVEDAIQVMTDDFNANNNGVENVQEAFADIIGDVGIEFRLAKLDPEGNCTNGVVRTFSNLTTSGGENLKTVSPIWDRSKYMNIWVCKTIASGAAGYTYYPSSLAGDFGETNDGIVVRYDYVGSIGESTLGRRHVLSHEVGHWIDLPHPWGSTNAPEIEANCDTDDGVADTPNTIGWTTCNLNGESCGSLDNVENFMGYSYCGKMFTEGQKTRMIASLTSTIAERSSLSTEENLEATGVFFAQLCDADFSSDNFSVCIGETINYQDQSHSGVVERLWIFEGGSPATTVIANPEIVYSTPGIYSVSLAVVDSFGNQLTEVKEAFVQVLDTAFLSLPYGQSFESIEAFSDLEDGSLYTENLFDDINWEISTQAGFDDNHSAVFRAIEVESATLARSAFVSKTFQMSDVGDLPVLSFKRAGARSSTTSEGELWVFISKNCGDFWSLRRVYDDGDAYTNEGIFPEGYLPNEEDWLSAEIDNIVPVFQNEEFRFRFEYRGTNGGTLYIDDINLIDGTTLSTAFQSAPEARFAMFPNPATNMVTLKFPDDVSDSKTILLRDLSGRIIHQAFIPKESVREYRIELNNLSSGIYLVEVRGSNGSSAKKLVVD